MVGANDEPAYKMTKNDIESTVESTENSDEMPRHKNPRGNRSAPSIFSYISSCGSKLLYNYTQPRLTNGKPQWSTKNFIRNIFLPEMNKLAQECEATNILKESGLENALQMSDKQNSDSLDLQSMLAALVICSKNRRYVDLLVDHTDLIIKLIEKLHFETEQEKNKFQTLSSWHWSLSRNNKTQQYAMMSSDGGPPLSERSYESNPTSDCLSDLPREYTAYLDPKIKTSLQCQVELATYLANISRKPQIVLNFMRHSCFTTLLDLWRKGSSFHLNLLVEKILLNHKASSQRNSSFFPTYHVDVFRLDTNLELNEADIEMDVVFVNGMNGSVFYSWRQHDSARIKDDSVSYSKCWPRDWLIREYPRARILGLNATLKPFVWNQLCPVDRINRKIDERALEAAQQLIEAGLGRRPIIWVTHSAGGILVKQILHTLAYICSICKSAKVTNNEESLIDICLKKIHNSTSMTFFEEEDLDNVYRASMGFLSSSKDKQNEVPEREEELSIDFNSGLDDLSHDLALIPSLIERCYTSAIDAQISNSSKPVDMSAVTRMIVDSQGNLRLDSAEFVVRNTRGIIFMSVPHKGNQSLFTLYKFPFRCFLSPEAHQLKTNNSDLLKLHNWFKNWARRNKTKVLTMSETEKTPIYPLYDCVLVPSDPEDETFGEVLLLKKDHTSISKPFNQEDAAYTAIVNFIHALEDDIKLSCNDS